MSAAGRGYEQVVVLGAPAREARVRSCG
jgi:hypothetical protein